MARPEADGPLAEHLQAIGNDECIYDDRDVYAVLEAASLITELEVEVERLKAERTNLRATLRGMVEDHPFVMDGDNGAMVASWFVHEAKDALANATVDDVPASAG